MADELKEITVIEARDLLRSKDTIQTIDVRSPKEFEKGSLEGAINIPLNHISREIHAINPNLPTLLICNDGSTSQRALTLLEACDFKAQVIRGGLQDWTKVIGSPFE